MEWSLNELYESLDSSAFKKDLLEVTHLIDTLNRSVDDTEKYLSTYIAYRVKMGLLFSYVNLRISTNTEDSDALNAYEKLEQIQTTITGPQTKFIKRIGQIDDLITHVESSPLLKDHLYILQEMKSHAKYMLADDVEMTISKLKMTGSSAFETLWTKITSGLDVPFTFDQETTTLTLSEVRNKAYDASREVRKAAYEAEINSYPKIETAAAACLNGIKGEVITLTEMRGYGSPLEQTLLDARLSEKALQAMIDAMMDFLPELRKYFKAKAKLITGEDALKFYDLFAPVGTVEKKYSYEEAKSFVIQNFASFSDRMSDFAKHAFENKWVDVSPKKGKVGGAFCHDVYGLKESRILLNFSGDLGGVTTIAHELGHGYHNLNLFNEGILNTDIPMVLAETASTFCEIIVANAVVAEGGDDAFVMLETSLQGASQVIVDILSRYLFETKVFETRMDHSPSVDELKTFMLEAQKATYGDGLDENVLHPYMWICKPHYYSGDQSFYNFPYAFGLLFAQGLYSKFIEEGKLFTGKYDLMLQTSGKMSVNDVCKNMGVDIENKEFWNSSLNMIVKDINKFVDKVNALSTNN